MSEISKKNEIPKPEMPKGAGFRDIKPETNTSLSEAKNFVEQLFNGASADKLSECKREVFGGRYVDRDTRYAVTPVDGPRGSWEGGRGDSKYIPSAETADGRNAMEKLAAKGMNGIEYKNAEADFSKCAEATVSIENMTSNRSDNFQQADVKCAEQWNAAGKGGKTDWTANGVREWRRENKCTWHERCDTNTMDLVSQDIHEYFRHSGGCAECKARDQKNDGGGFDE